MNRYELLHATADLTINRFDHPPHEVHNAPEREIGKRWAVAFVQAGSFDVATNGSRQRLAKGSVFAFRPGLEFQCLHDEACPTDVCVSIAFNPSAISGLEHAWETAGWSARESATPKLAYVDRRMAGAVAAKDTFEMERWAIGSLTALHADAEPQSARGHYAARKGVSTQ